MKINVEVEVPKGNRCNKCIYLDNKDEWCRLFNKDLNIKNWEFEKTQQCLKVSSIF